MQLYPRNPLTVFSCRLSRHCYSQIEVYTLLRTTRIVGFLSTRDLSERIWPVRRDRRRSDHTHTDAAQFRPICTSSGAGAAASGGGGKLGYFAASATCPAARRAAPPAPARSVSTAAHTSHTHTCKSTYVLRNNLQSSLLTFRGFEGERLHHPYLQHSRRTAQRGVNLSLYFFFYLRLETS